MRWMQRSPALHTACQRCRITPCSGCQSCRRALRSCSRCSLVWALRRSPRAALRQLPRCHATLAGRAGAPQRYKYLCTCVTFRMWRHLQVDVCAIRIWRIIETCKLFRSPLRHTHSSPYRFSDHAGRPRQAGLGAAAGAVHGDAPHPGAPSRQRRAVVRRLGSRKRDQRSRRGRRAHDGAQLQHAASLIGIWRSTVQASGRTSHTCILPKEAGQAIPNGKMQIETLQCRCSPV